MTAWQGNNCLKASTSKIILSCEHGGNHVPKDYQKLFSNRKSVLNTHRAWDKGALSLAKILSKKLSVPLVYSETTRLLVDLNRSLHHHHLFSEFTRHCDKQTKEKILHDYYHSYRRRVESLVDKSVKKNITVVHYSIHSFTPKLNGDIRNADIGLLYDPKRKKETYLCKRLQKYLQNLLPSLNIRRNYPYRGTADGLTTHLRRKFSQKNYCGIEIEINQKHVLSNAMKWSELQRLVSDAINNALTE